MYGNLNLVPILHTHSQFNPKPINFINLIPNISGDF